MLEKDQMPESSDALQGNSMQKKKGNMPNYSSNYPSRQGVWYVDFNLSCLAFMQSLVLNNYVGLCPLVISFTSNTHLYMPTQESQTWSWNIKFLNLHKTKQPVGPHTVLSNVMANSPHMLGLFTMSKSPCCKALAFINTLIQLLFDVPSKGCILHQAPNLTLQRDYVGFSVLDLCHSLWQA